MSRYEILLKNNRISNTWWGQQWTRNIDMYSDIYNRLERGRSYLRKNTIKAIDIKNNIITALVQGSDVEPYKVKIQVDNISKEKYEIIYAKLMNKIENINQLCSGSFPKELQDIFTATENGIFPSIDEISFGCSCPDVAIMCKHIAAVLYGVGNLLDNDPMILFQLRGFNLQEFLDNILIEKSDYYLEKANNVVYKERVINDNIDNISQLFGIELEEHNFITEQNDETFTDKVLNEDELFSNEILLHKSNEKRNVTSTIKNPVEQNKIKNEILIEKNLNILDEARKKRKDEIQQKIYDETLSLDELFEIRKEINSLDFSKFDIDYVEDLINEKLNEFDNVSELEDIKIKMKKSGINTNSIEKLINLKSPLTEEKILNFEKEDLEYIIYDVDLTINQWIVAIAQMKKYDFSKFDYETAYDYLNELIEEIDSLNQLENIREKMKKYKLKTDFITKLIYKIKNNVQIDEKLTEEDKALFEYLDQRIEELPMEVLVKTKEKTISEHGDTEILDKAINNKIKKQKEQEKMLQRERKLNRKSIFWTLISTIFGASKDNKKLNNDFDLTSYEQEEINKGNYEPYQFEEEELEDDDYYFEDDN